MANQVEEALRGLLKVREMREALRESGRNPALVCSQTNTAPASEIQWRQYERAKTAAWAAAHAAIERIEKE